MTLSLLTRKKKAVPGPGVESDSVGEEDVDSD